MKTPKSLLMVCLVCLPFSLLAQVQWFQNQDGNNPPPSGTFGSCARSFTPNSFVACYQWNSNNETYTWKVSKSHINGTEQKSFFVSGTWASVETKVGRYHSLYVLLRSFPLEGNAVFKVYKLDTNLVVKAQRVISLPNNFSIFNINAFELDRTDNIYLAGDGQYPNGADFIPASFVMKADKNLNIKWKSVDAVATSFAQLQIEPTGRVVVIEDFYTFFPQVKIRKYSSNGMLMSNRSLNTDPGRFNLLSKLDEEGDLLLYGGKSIGDTAQAMFVQKISRNTGNLIYSKTHFRAMGIQLHDLTFDNDGRIFSLVSQYMSSGEQQCLVSRINPFTGNIHWSRSYQYSTDSCVLNKLVVDESDRFFVLGERRNSSFLSKGVVLRIKKNGQQDGGYNGPDSVGYQRSHTLVDGLTDRNGQLITIGNTNDFDPFTYNSTYFRAFAVRFGESRNHHGCDNKGGSEPETITAAASEKSEEVMQFSKLAIYPNPVQNELTVNNINKEDFDQLSIYNMQGALVQKQMINSATAKLDVTALTDGVYLLVFRSSVTMKEKSIKFIVNR